MQADEIAFVADRETERIRNELEDKSFDFGNAQIHGIEYNRKNRVRIQEVELINGIINRKSTFNF